MPISSDDDDFAPATRIQYASRTPSPIQTVHYAMSDDEIISPQKRKRVQVNPRKTRVQSEAIHHGPEATAKPKELEIHPITTAGALDSPSNLSDDFYDPTPEICAEALAIPENVSYLAFLNSLDWDDSMFTPLSNSNRLFVVHGWNNSRLEAMVSNPSTS